jgi:hypothetical protein
MEQASLQAMTEGQLNEVLVQDLSRESNYLRKLCQSYFGISKLRHMRVFWGYETRTSPTVEVSFFDPASVTNNVQEIFTESHRWTVG